MSANGQRSLRILHVEDNLGDVRLIGEAFRENGHSHEILVATDGAQALDYLFRRKAHVHAPRPDLILLDLNLPKCSGHEVLAEMKKDPDLRQVPVVIFTSSDAPSDISAAYGLRANCYVTKPADVEELFGVIAAIDNFWLSLARLPKK